MGLILGPFLQPGPDIFSIYISGRLLVTTQTVGESAAVLGPGLGRAEGKHTSQMEQPSAIIMGPQQPGK